MVDKVQETVKVTFPFRSPSGVGNAQKERECCEKIHVFISCAGYTGYDRRRILLDKDKTIRDAINSFGRDRRQSRVVDENGFQFRDEDLDEPLWRVSDKCMFQLVFVDDTP